MKKWFRRIGLGLLALLGVLAALGTTYEQWSRWHAGRTHLPPGRLIDVGGHSLHLECSGTGTPTVILEAGADLGGGQSWFAIRPELAEMTRVCTYDRAGYAWSDPGPEPRDALTIAAELHRLLERGSEASPFVLVGHSLGGAFVRVFADRYPDEVAGLVFVDSSHPEEEERRPPELSMDRLVVRVSEWAFRIAAETGVLRLVISLDLPRSFPETFAAFSPQGVATLVSEFEAVGSTLAEDQEAGLSEDLPLVVLTGGQALAGLRDELRERMESVRLAMQRELAAFTGNSDHRILPDAGHFIQHDDPEAVIRAVADVVAAVRDGSPIGTSRP